MTNQSCKQNDFTPDLLNIQKESKLDKLQIINLKEDLLKQNKIKQQ